MVQNSAWNEFEYVKYKNKDGKIIIQPKEDLFREGIASPNCVDAAVLTMVMDDSAIRSNRIIKMNRGRPFHDQMSDIWNDEVSTIERYHG